jgi:transposase
MQEKEENTHKKKSVNERKPFGRKVEEQPKSRESRWSELKMLQKAPENGLNKNGAGGKGKTADEVEAVRCEAEN